MPFWTVTYFFGPQVRVVTQLGNPGSANSRFREAVEVVWSGAIGTVREVHVWSDRPFWPTGVSRPERVDPVPPTWSPATSA